MATALTCVNSVLRRLRETQVTTFSAEYTLLILEFVNEAKREVEDAWNWTMLRQNITVTTVSGTQAYTLTGAGQRYRIYDRQRRLYDATNDGYIYEFPGDEIEALKWVGTTTNSIPCYYRIIGDVNGDPTVEFYPTPNGAFTIKVPLVIPQADFTATTDTLTLPSLPIIMGAWARAISERGEDQGVKSTDQWNLYMGVLGDYIAMDMARVPEESTWMVV